MAAPERKVGVIREVTVEGTLGTKQYSLVLTDRRTIFVLLQASKEHLAGAVAGLAGVAVNPVVRRGVDVAHAEPHLLAADPANLAIPHASLTSLQMVKKWARHRLLFEYTDENGRRKKVEAFPDVPWKVVGDASKHGVHPKETIAHHMSLVRDAFLRALPPAIAQRTSWEL